MTTFKILSCDGGGIRGLLTSILLEALEEELQRLDSNSTLQTCFDLFTGTSTGSIIACGLAKGISARKIRKFYEKEGEKIFPKMYPAFWVEEVLERVRKGHLSLPLFQPDSLEEVLRSPDIFPEILRFGELGKEKGKQVLITSYDTYNREAVIFKNTDPKFANIPVWQICRSSSAAPVAFPGFLLRDSAFLEALTQDQPNFEGDLPKEIPPEGGIPLIDGGVVANNPSLCAIAEGIDGQHTTLDKILVASFGTGQSKRRITPDEAKNWGALDWADLAKGIPLYEVCSDGSADVIDYIARSLLNNRYLRYQPVIDPKISTFQADKDNLDLLSHAAENYLETGGSDRLKKLANKLICNRA